MLSDFETEKVVWIAREFTKWYVVLERNKYKRENFFWGEKNDVFPAFFPWSIRQYNFENEKRGQKWEKKRERKTRKKRTKKMKWRIEKEKRRSEFQEGVMKRKRQKRVQQRTMHESYKEWGMMLLSQREKICRKNKKQGLTS